MCKTKMAVNASDPNSTPRRRAPSTRPSSTHSPALRTPSRLPTFPPPNNNNSSSSTSSFKTEPSRSANDFATSSSALTASSRTSLSSLRDSISQKPHIYDISEIQSATNNFLSKPYGGAGGGASKCWRCTLRNTDTLVFQRKFRRKLSAAELKDRLGVVCRSHHVSVVKLLGASVSGDDYIYLVYEFVIGANLSDCLRNRLNPNFTVLSAWSSRVQIVTDIAHALDYIHHKTGLNLTLVHNYIKSTGIIITDPSLNAKICHFGAAYLCGEIIENDNNDNDETELKIETSFEGVRGYMSPEFQLTGVPTRKNDVFAFGVVVLELLSGEEPLKYRFDKGRGDFVRTSVIETAREAVEGGEGALRRWVDRRLKDSFPVEVVEKLVRLALECVHVEADKRPNMGRVAGKVSKLYLKSGIWSEALRAPNDMISVSLAPR